MPRAGPRKVQRYSLEFKLKAVKLSQLKGVEVQAVADALEIHPVHAVAVAEGGARRRAARAGVGRRRRSKTPPAREMKRFQALQRAHALLAGGARAAKKTHPVHLRTKADVFAFIEARTRSGSV